MAIYHLEAKIISRATGRTAVAAAAYQSGEKLYNDYDGITHDYTRKGGVLYSEIILPPNAPAAWADRQTLWNAVEAAEKQKDSRLARQLVTALPTELHQEEWVHLLREFVQTQCVANGMCADFAIHNPDGHNPHAHIMLTMRPLDAQGNWTAKTQKEYQCRRGGEERGFTAPEFLQKKDEGWEKQYKYRTQDGTTGWYAPSVAALHPEWGAYLQTTKIYQAWARNAAVRAVEQPTAVGRMARRVGSPNQPLFGTSRGGCPHRPPQPRRTRPNRAADHPRGLHRA